MTITSQQFDGQYSADEIEAMNHEVERVLAEHQFAAADLSAHERDEIRAAVENEVAGSYDPNIGWSGTVELMPAAWARLIASRL